MQSTRVDEHEVVIVGGGPTGMMLAAELRIAGVDPVVVERRPSTALDGSRAGGLHARTIEVLDQRGVAERFLEAGTVMQTTGFAGIPLDISDFPTRHPYGLALWQSDFERIMGEWVDELGVRTVRGCDVIGLEQDDDGVDIELSDGGRLRARFVVGCDGGRSLVRKRAGIEFVGAPPSRSWILAEVQMTERPPLGMLPEGGGIGPADRFGDGSGPYRATLVEARVDHDAEPTLADFASELVRRFGTDFGAHSPTWVTRFTDASLQASSYRAGRVLIAGDAAHIHAPTGGQGLNVGVQDAVNLGWKLARVVGGRSSAALLDTYHAERHPVAARVIHNTMAQVALGHGDDRHQALKEVLADVLRLDAARRTIAGMMSGLDVRYDVPTGTGDHPAIGWRMPDLDLSTANGTTRVAELLRDAQPVLLDLGTTGSFDMAPWPHVRVVHATAPTGAWELPVLGEVPAAAAVLIRPDGHVAWAGDLAEPTLPVALGQWFGGESV